MKPHQKKDGTLVYIPPGAQINVDNIPMDSPKVIYEERRKNIDRTIVRQVSKHRSKDM